MKINLAFVSLAFFVMTSIHAQVTFKPGIHAGINVSKITNSDLNSKTDFYIGAFGALKLSKFYTLQPELTYSRQGAKGSIDGYYFIYQENGQAQSIYETRNLDISLQYLSFVTMNKFNLTENIYLLAGPFFDIMVGDEFKIDTSNNYQTIMSKGEDIDFGIIGGVGYNLPKGISLEARIKKGIRDAFDDNTGSANVNTNLVYQIGATYTFGK